MEPGKGRGDSIKTTIASIGTDNKRDASFILICICPHCGGYVDEVMNECPNCNAILVPDEDGEEPSKDLLEIKNSIFLCHHCGAFIGEDITHCRACGSERITAPVEFGTSVSAIKARYDLSDSSGSLLETSPNLFICKQCGAFLSPSTTKCGICGLEKGEDDGESITSVPRIEEGEGGVFFASMLSNQGELSICGHCGAFMSDTAESCGMCGVEKTLMLVCEDVAVDSEIQGENGAPEIALLMCDQCGAFVATDAHFCSSCGIDISSEEPYEDEEIIEIESESILESSDNMAVFEILAPGALDQDIETEPGSVLETTDNDAVLEKLSPNPRNHSTRKAAPVEMGGDDSDKKYRTWWLKKARVLKKLGRYTEAVKCLNHAMSNDHDNIEIMAEKANLFYYLKRYEQASRLFKKILEIEPKNIDVWNRLGNAQFKLGHVRESQICYEKVLSLDSTNNEALINKGYLFLRQKRYEEAMGFAQKIAA